MKKNLKKNLLAASFALAIVCAGVGVSSVSSVSASAQEEIPVVTASTFEMNVGASIHTVAPARMRFTANFGSETYDECFDESGNAESGKELGMLMVPASYFADYEAYVEENPDYEVDGKEMYYEYFRDVKGKMIDQKYVASEVVENATDNYSIRLSLKSILYENSNLEYISLAYVATTVDDATTYRYASFNEAENARSAAYVAAVEMNGDNDDAFIAQYVQKSALNTAGATYDSATDQYTLGQTTASLSEIVATDGYNVVNKLYGKEYILYSLNLESDVDLLGVKLDAETLAMINESNVQENKYVFAFPTTYEGHVENSGLTAPVGLRSSNDTDQRGWTYNGLFDDIDLTAYAYFEWNIYSREAATDVLIGGATKDLAAGWNTVRLTAAELCPDNTAARRIYYSADLRTDTYIGVDLLIGDLKGVVLTPDITFLGTPITVASLQANSPNLALTATNDATYLDEGSEVGIGLMYASGKSDGNLYYTDLVPADEPDYDYYIWRIWSRNDATANNLGEYNNYQLVSGWNDVKFTWNQLNVTYKRMYFAGVLSSSQINVALGSLTGYNYTPDVTFLGTAIDTSKITSHEKTSAVLKATVETTYLDEGSEVGIGVYAKSGTEGGLNYTNLIPAEQPEYDYYIWRVWSRNAITGVNFGNTTVNFAAGWNDIQLTWSQLTNTNTAFQRIYMTGLSTSQINVALGSLTGHNYERATFLGQEMTTDKFAVDGTSAYVCYADGGIGVYGYSNSAGSGGVSYAALIPTENPGYDYYKIEVWSANAIASDKFHFSGNWMALEAGWNTIYLTWGQLNNTKSFYVTGGLSTSASTINFVLGNVTGQNGEIPTAE